MQVRLNRSVRARRISLRISRDGEVVLTYPWYGRKADALRFLQQKQDWVQKNRFARKNTSRSACRKSLLFVTCLIAG